MMRVWSHRPQSLHLALFFAAYVLGCGFAKVLGIAPGTNISIWPPGGLFMATLIVASPPSWPWWMLVGCPAELLSQLLWWHSPLPAGFLMYVGNALEAAAGAWLVNRTCKRPVRMETLQEVLALVVLGAGLAPIISATVGSATLAWFGIKSQSFATAWPLWWIGDATGVLLVAPPVLVVLHNWRRKAQLSAVQWIEAGVLGLIFLGAAALSLSGYDLPFAYIIMPPLLWAAVRFEFKGVAVALTLLALITVIFTISGASQFVGDAESQKQKQIMLQLFLAISAFSALIVAAISRQHQVALLTLRQSVEALRERERELSRLVDIVPVHIRRLTPEGEPVFFNRRLIDFLGLDVADLEKLGMSRLATALQTLVHPDDVTGVRETVRHSLANGEPYAMKYRIRRADGAYRWVDGRAESVRDEGGAIAQWYSVSFDIDDQVRAEEALRGLAVTAMALNSCRSLDEVVRTITDRAREIIGAHMAVIGTTIDQNWGQSIQAVSLSEKFAAYRDFDAKPDGSGIYAVVCDLNRPMRLTQAQLEAHPAWRGYGKYADQHPRLRGWLAVPLVDSNGRNMGLLQLSDKDQGDFTAEDEGIAVQLAQMASLAIGGARLHESLANSERQFRLLAEAIPQHVLTFGRDGSLHYCNQRWMGYTGLTLPAAQSGGWQTTFHPDEARAVLQAWKECCGHGSLYEREVRVRGIDGQYRRFLTRAVPITDGEGSIAQWFWTNTDIEESKLGAEALHKAQADLARVARLTTMGELAASIAHEVNQPLAAIVANSHACHRWLSTEPPNIERAKITAERITRDANSAAEVVSRVRALFSQMAKARSPADITQVIGEVCRLMADELAVKKVRVETEFDRGLPPALIDRVQMQQVLVNLMRNAIDALDAIADGTRVIRLRAVLDGDNAIRVEVRDLGAGLKEPERVFEPFFTTKENGMGMGLAICRSIIEAHDGRLWAADNQPRGTTLAFTLPVQARDAA